MDADKLINKDRRGTYSVLFPNHCALDTTKVEAIFNQFGQVRSVQIVGSERGTCFVCYETIAEAIQAVEGLRNHPQIRLGTHYRKDSDRNEKKSSRNTDTACPKVHQITWEPVISDDSSENSSSGISSGDSLRGQKSTSMKERIKESRSRNLNHAVNYGADSGGIPDLVDSKHNIVKNQSAALSRCRSFNSSSMTYVNKQQTFAKDRCVDGRPFDLRNLDATDDDVPDLVDRRGKAVGEMKPVMLNASEVVVGNIPADFCEGYLLYMFGKHEPLGITRIQLDPRTKLRYCHVYFKKGQDAADLEARFDGYALSGKKLIVMQPSQLMFASRN